ncbi:MAG: Leukotoxin export protein LtxD [Chroococcidiopsis sp. SAG 2025]|uniref:HlyD family secretion protein n=1 Tax=Chroococcidiopsis sp. SAG 2025 TaxID=171389 RepID=UPI002936E89C|nr:HlyD family efflux transporter periplasmic adaptor subunit [Chroococcidiopsis sp. SAG 2025]MDV2995824.1 Leukotoxin export protein LtxD [Chroococcidiopsis sp. SAG 2025]
MVSEVNPESLRIVESEEFLPSISPTVTIGGGVLVVAFSAAVSLAATLNYNVTVKAPASIRGEVQIVQSASDGVVRNITVKENQLVKKGDAIAYVDNSQILTRRNQLLDSVQQSRSQLRQISSQLSSIDSQIAAESNLSTRSVASAQAELQLQQRDYLAKQQTAIAEVQVAQASLDLAREEMQRYRQLANTGAIPILQVKEKEQAYKAAQAKVNQAKANLNPSNATVSIANERIAQEEARGMATVAALQKERKNLVSNQIELQNQVARDTKEVQQMGVELSKTMILSPTDGTVLKLELRNPGQVVSTGQAIAQISRTNSRLDIKTYVPGAEISKIKPGQQVQMRVSACPYPDYGTLKGVVKTVAPDVVPTASGAASESPTPAGAYEVTIQPNTWFVGTGDRLCRLQPGMEGTVDIISKSETPLQFVLRKARILSGI